ncbi:MAG TPA: hypothetical protein VK550_05705 [Polyangiaceae bacterium]|jgi:hypothetical protein|nr:hypothetical protein [Polyangiaceae bacterium]
MRRKIIVAVLSLLTVCVSNRAFADAPPAAGARKTEGPLDESEKGLWDATPATRRSGFTAGLMGGLSFGTVIGYPNDFSKWDQPAYRSATSGVGNGGTIYLGGALTDWFTFGIGFEGSTYGGSRNLSREWAILFHTEVFPLFSLGRVYRDIGVFADFGTGMATINRRSDQAEYSSSGTLSIGGLGVFWETWRLAGHLALGPFVSGTFESSDSLIRVFGLAGFRAAFYGGP